MLLNVFVSSLFLFTLLEATPLPPLPLVVQTPEFETTGFELSDGGQVVSHAFLSLPYAKPPVGELRFEKTVPLEANATRKIQATELPKGCIQQQNLDLLDPVMHDLYPTSEDCLYLNVMTPPEPSEDPNGYPVLVWIHGGGFVYGMSRFYGWEQLAKHFNPRKVIVVGIQYRIFALGFFSFGDSGLPGNYGLWDQNAALKWINQRISLFGGNPNKVTIWGNSAGSASVHSQTISPHSNTLFHQSIQSSGSLYSPWGKTTKTYDISHDVAQKVGCTGTNSTVVKQCMKGVTVQALWDAVAPYGAMRYSIDFLLWTPVMDNDFFGGKTVPQLTQLAPKKPTIYGVTKGEGLICTLKTPSVIASVFADKLGLEVSEQAAYSKANFTEMADTYAVEPSFAGPNANIIRFLFNTYYERNEASATPTNKFWFKRFTEVITEATQFGPVTEEIRDKKLLGWNNQYIYIPAYIHPAHRPDVGEGLEDWTPHAYEYQYLTDAQPYFEVNKSSFNAAELALTDRLVSGFAQFVKTGSPGTPAKPWPKVTNVLKPTYLKLGETSTIENTMLTKPGLLWQAISLLGYGDSTQNF